MRREMEAFVFTTVLLLFTHLFLAVAVGSSVIIVGAGFSGISAAKTLSDAGITNIIILEATNRIGGRICKVPFAGIYVEKGANWVAGVNGNQVNPIWTMSNQLGLRKFYSDYGNLSSNTYKEQGGLNEAAEVQSLIDTAKQVYDSSEQYSKSLPPNGSGDISILASQRLQNHAPSSPAEMAVDYYNFDYLFGEPPRVTSLQNTVPLPTFANYGEDVYFVADQRGYETVVHHVANQFLKTNKDGTIVDPRLLLNKHFEREYPGAHLLLVMVTDDESRRIEQQSDSTTKAEAMEVLREMFGKNIPEATDIFVPRWWSDRFYKVTFSNWPIGVNKYEYDQIRAPVGRIYFTGEHTSENYNGFVHGAYLAGIDSANILIKCVKTGDCKYIVKAKDAVD